MDYDSDGYIICATCGLVGHTMGKCPDKVTAATKAPAQPRVVDVPRRCTCGAPTLHTVTGAILDDRAGLRHLKHRCSLAIAA